MGNIYTNKEGIRVMEVEYGWGMEMEAYEFPLELAITGRNVIEKYFRKNPKAQRPSLMFALSYCFDVIDNAKNGDGTFILEEFFGEQVNTIKQVIKELEKA